MRSEIVDVTMVYHGTDTLTVLKRAHQGKMEKHHRAYNCRGYTFVPFVTTTGCKLHTEAKRFLSFLAIRMAQIQIAFRPSERDFEELVDLNTARVHSVVGAAIAKGMALRACGLACAKHAMDPPSRGWRTQEDLLEGKDWGDLVEFD
jgi:hypothetical protein